MFNFRKYEGRIPLSTIDGLEGFFLRFQPPGDFLRAVLENDLMEAFGRADEWNTAAMKDIAGALYNEAPVIILSVPDPTCEYRKPFGSKENVDWWLSIFQRYPEWAADWTRNQQLALVQEQERVRQGTL